MTPVECSLDGEVFLTTGTGSTEAPVPGAPIVINYSGDECGSIVSLKTPEGDHMTDFTIQTVGKQQIMRFEQTVDLPVEKGKSGNVVVQRTLNFKRV